ncbi:MAG: IS110 family transposase [Candidatus Omnitrophica bacterium]|nr:IS110 family transposase [Candidatus Omnitrophota bacterium]
MEKIIAYAGNDVHQEFIKVAVYRGNEIAASIEKTIRNDKGQIQKFYKKLKKEYDIRACYEAGSCGYVFYRWLNEIEVKCEVIAPSLIPKRVGDRIKTDQRDAQNLGRLYRAGELVAVHVPSEEAEADRSVVRLRDQIRKEIHQSKQYILKFLQVRGLRYEGVKNWTQKHWDYVRKIKFENAEDQFTYRRYVEMLEYKLSELVGVEEKIKELAFSKKHEEVVKKLRCLRGVDILTAITFATEIIDCKRFSQPREIMAYLGLIPSQYSSGAKQRYGRITGTGNSRLRRILVEAAWHYRHPPRISKELKKRQEGQDLEVINYAWKAQKRLYKRFTDLGFRKNKKVAVVAVARELTGFIWSLMVNENNYSGIKTA